MGSQDLASGWFCVMRLFGNKISDNEKKLIQHFSQRLYISALFGIEQEIRKGPRSRIAENLTGHMSKALKLLDDFTQTESDVLPSGSNFGFPSMSKAINDLYHDYGKPDHNRLDFLRDRLSMEFFASKTNYISSYESDGQHIDQVRGWLMEFYNFLEDNTEITENNTSRLNPSWFNSGAMINTLNKITKIVIKDYGEGIQFFLDNATLPSKAGVRFIFTRKGATNNWDLIECSDQLVKIEGEEDDTESSRCIPVPKDQR